MTKMLVLVLLLSFLVLSTAMASRPAAVSLPKHEYSHAAYTRTAVGTGATGAVLFLPSEPRLTEAPVVCFTHGFMATSPDYYLGWVEHLVRSGNAVIFPNYQRALPFGGLDFQNNCAVGLRKALKHMTETERVTPDLGRFYCVGHSVGGMLAWWIASNAQAKGLPQPKVVFAVEPGGRPGIDPQHKPPADCLVVALAGDSDRAVGFSEAKRMYEAAKKAAPKNCAFVTLVSDRTGEPNLIADHFAPLAMRNPPSLLPHSSGIDAHDRMMWTLFDELIEQSQKEQPSLMKALIQKRPRWSDGRDIAPIYVTLGTGGHIPERPKPVTHYINDNYRSSGMSSSEPAIERSKWSSLVLVTDGGMDGVRAARCIGARDWWSILLQTTQREDLKGHVIETMKREQGLPSGKPHVLICLSGSFMREVPDDLVCEGGGVVVIANSIQARGAFRKTSVPKLVVAAQDSMSIDLTQKLEEEGIRVYTAAAANTALLLEGLFKANDDAGAVILDFMAKIVGQTDMPDPMLRWTPDFMKEVETSEP
ncbi:MAG: hypothetical protein Kow00107_01720 [Planctomycetota bacterium]